MKRNFAFLFLIFSLIVLGPSVFSPLSHAQTSWVECTPTSFCGGYGEAVVGTGDSIYIVRCLYATSEVYFWKYDPKTDTWSSLSTPSVNGETKGIFRGGTSLAWDGEDHIYALAGARYSDSDRRLFLRYSISTDKWEILPDTPHPQGAGNALCWSGYDNKLYAFLGSREHGTIFACYDPATNSWTVKSDPPGWTDDGASLVWTGGKYIYALRGEYYETAPCRDFWRYNIETDTWEILEPIPDLGGVGDGASLIWVGNFIPELADFIYALGGGSCYEDPGYGFYRYSISSDTWEILDDIPYPVGYYVGNRLGFAEGHLFYWQGTPSTWPGGGNRFCAYPLIDNIPPTCTITQPDEGTYVSGTVQVTANATDNIAVEKVELYVNNTLQDIDNEVPYEWSWDTTTYEDGTYTLTVIAYDTFSNTNTTKIIITIDNTEPNVSIVFPASGSWVRGVVNISVSINDSGSGVERVTFIIDGNMLFNDTVAPYEYSLNTTLYLDGEHTITVIAYDRAGNSRTTSVVFYVDNSPPIVEMIYPTEGDFIKGTVNITVSVDDFGVGVEKILFIVDGTILFNDTNAPYSYVIDTNTYDDGLHNLTILAYDKLGSMSSITITLFIDNTAPLVSINFPVNDSLHNGIICINTTCEDINIETIELYVNSTLIASWNTSGIHVYEWNTTTYLDGIYELRVLVVDKAGNIATEFVRVMVDNSGPTIGEVSQVPLIPRRGENVTISVSISDLSNVANATLYYKVEGVWNSVEMVLSGDVWVATIPRQESGAKIEYYIEAYDILGNKALSKTYSYVVYETVPPSMKIEQPLNNSFIRGIVNVSVDVFDSSGVEKIEIYINGELVYTDFESPYEWMWNTSALNDGAFILEVKAFDIFQNTNTTKIMVTIDNTPPSLNIISPEEELYARGVFNISLIVEDSLSGIAKIFVIIDNTMTFDIIEEPYQCSVDSTSLADGEHNITVVAYDKAGNNKTVSIVFYVDNTAPSVGIVFPANGSWVSGVVNISVSAEDVGSGVDYVAFGIYGSPELLCNDTVEPYEYSWDTESYAEGKQLLAIIVKDKVGNYQCVVLEYYVDNTPPSISAVECPSEVEENVAVKINVTVTDVGSGVDEVILSYSVDGGETWVNLTATAKSGDVYETAIPGQTAGTTVQLKVIAVDETGNVAVSQTYSYEVVSEEQPPEEGEQPPPEEETPLPSPLGASWTLIGGIGAVVIAVVVLIIARRRG
nr:Ig-like domain-containing protein [Candidatus Baldrarchaeota archaeon]